MKYLCDSEIDEHTITTLTNHNTTLTTAHHNPVAQMNCKKTKITELDEQIVALITNPDKLTDAREFEDSVVEKKC